jgi:eukaryotic-like serine/threonine-protein kinase
VSGLSDAAVNRLRRIGNCPEFEGSRYSIVEEIGRGGMGTVFLARDEVLGRDVAIKIPNSLNDEGRDRRLQLEARALAKLEHPGIVPIHDAGRLADGRQFYVMKRVEGRTLHDYMVAVTDVAARLQVFERICEPVAFAHARGVIHRDLKPDNVMVGAFGEVMVMDWGAAKTVDSRESSVDSPSRQSQSSVDSHETAAGTVIGTRGFMAPEQASGDREIDVRADVYGLGAILFLLLTNELPPANGDPGVMLRRHGVPRPLTAICAKAIAADSTARYQGAAVLGEDIARYRAGRAVAAYRETAAERVVRFGRTYRTPILLVLAYVVMRTAVAVFAGW